MIPLLATGGVYGLAAMIVRMDVAGFLLVDRARYVAGGLQTMLIVTGRLLVSSLPKIIRLLGIIGTIAMLLVGDGMFTHNIRFFHDLLHSIPELLLNLMLGVAVGAVVLAVESLVHHFLDAKH